MTSRASQQGDPAGEIEKAWGWIAGRLDRLVKTLDIAGRTVGPEAPCFIIAEAGVNHNGSLELAEKLIDAAVRAGADAVKFQTFIADKLVAPDTPMASYQIANTRKNHSQHELIRTLELPWDGFKRLKQYADHKDILFLSTPFDEDSADFLETIGTAAFKIPSGEVSNHILLRHIAKKERPIILSTGMSTLDEVATAVTCLREAGGSSLAILHCVSNYPTNPREVNLRAMDTLSQKFHPAPIGFSDHSLGIEIALAARARGACIIEKHFTLDKAMAGPDHLMSLDTNELKDLVRGIRTVEAALGDGQKILTTAEEQLKLLVRRSLAVKRVIEAGEVIVEEMLTSIRPASGVSPQDVGSVIGRRAARKLSKGTILDWNDIV